MLANACCCDPSCLIESDDFDRANNNAIGDKWSDSNARIIDNKLGPQALGAMLVLTTKNHISETMVVDVTMSFSSGSISLDKGIVIVNAKDSNNYLFVQIEVSNSLFSGTAVSTKLKFYRRSGGVNTQLGSTRTLDATNALNNQQVRVCYDGTYLKALGYREAATKITDGFKAGLAAEGSTTIYHDNFRWYKYSAKCPRCTENINCVSCTTMPSGVYAVDVGVGGLIDGSCSYCDQIVGEFIVGYVFNIGLSCYYQYSVAACAAHASCPQSLLCPSAYFLITLSLRDDGVGRVKWFLELDLNKQQQQPGRPCAGLCPGRSYYALYTSSSLDGANCNTTPVTLSKISETFSTDACTGSLPATVEIRAV